jgi:hypothetical protein
MQVRLAKFQRQPERVAAKELTSRDLDILSYIARYHILSSSLLVRLVSGNEDVTHRHLQLLYHRGLVARFAFPSLLAPGEFHYFLDSVEALQLIQQRAGVELEEADFEEVRRNKEKAYDSVHDRTQAAESAGRLQFLQHEVGLSRFHAMLELACRATAGRAELEQWKQGPSLWNKVTTSQFSFGNERTARLPHRPDAFFTLHFPNEPEGRQRAHFFYELDRKTTTTKRFIKKLRAHFEFIVRQRLHEKHYGIKRVRAVLVETTDPAWAERLREAARNPYVSGDTASPLFWFTVSEIFTRKKAPQDGATALPHFLLRPELVFDPIWISPLNDQFHSLLEI